MANAISNWVITLLFFTGFAGLVYEVVWYKYLANLLGSEGKAVALVVSVFLGGLSSGYYVFGRLSWRRSPRFLVKVTGFLEIGIGAWAVLFPNIYAGLFSFLVNNGSGVQGGALGFLFDLLASLILMLIPTLLMGATLPILTQALATNLRESGRVHARVYAVNTFGAFTGCLLAGFVLLPNLGLPLTNLYTGILNLFCGTVLVGLGRFFSESIPEEQIPEEPNPDKVDLPSRELATENLSFKNSLVVAFTSGFSAIAMQNILVRLTGLTLGSSEYAFCLVVAAFILVIALGSHRLTKKGARDFSLSRNQLTILAGFAVLFFTVPTWSYYALAVRLLFHPMPITFWLYNAVMFGLLLLLLWVPLAAMGRTMPLVFNANKNALSSIGLTVGKLYFVNTLGCVLGGLLGGYFLLYWLDLQGIYCICLCSLLIGFAFTLEWSEPKARLRSVRQVEAAAMLILLTIFEPWDALRLSIGTFRQHKVDSFIYGGPTKYFEHLAKDQPTVLYRRDGPSTSVAVVDSKSINRRTGESFIDRSIFVNGKSDGSSLGDIDNMLFAGHLGGLFNASAKAEAAVIGFGTGVTVGSLSLYPQIQHIDVIEIAPAVREAAPFFDEANYRASSQPKVSWIMADAYRELLSTNKIYQVIVSEPSNPWVSGIEKLFSQDFYQAVERKLAPNGVYVQWFHTYEISRTTVDLIGSTFTSVFPYVRLFQLNNDMFIVGAKESLDNVFIQNLTDTFSQPAIHKDWQRIDVKTQEEILAKELWFDPKYFSQKGIHTLDFPSLAYRAGYDFFLAENAPSLLVKENRPWIFRAFGRTLFDKFLPTTINPSGSQIGFTEQICQMPGLRLSADWINRSFPCTRLLIDLMLNARLLPREEELKSTLQTMANFLANRPKALEGKSVSEIRQLLSLLSRYLIPNQVSASRLASIDHYCQSPQRIERLNCEVSVIDLLASLGHEREAKQLMALTLPQISPELGVTLSSTLNEALRAQSL